MTAKTTKRRSRKTIKTYVKRFVSKTKKLGRFIKWLFWPKTKVGCFILGWWLATMTVLFISGLG